MKRGVSENVGLRFRFVVCIGFFFYIAFITSVDIVGEVVVRELRFLFWESCIFVFGRWISVRLVF